MFKHLCQELSFQSREVSDFEEAAGQADYLNGVGIQAHF